MFLRRRAWLPLCGVMLLAACAQEPIQPPPPAPVVVPRGAPPDMTLADALARHRQIAQRSAQAGDHATAVREWHVVTLLAPRDEYARAQLDAERAAVKSGVRENLRVGNAALSSGDSERANAAMLKVLALDPQNAEAMKVLRDIDRQKLQRVQSGRAARVNQSNGNGASATSAARAAPRNQEPSESYDIDQRIEMFRAGDIDGGLRELRAYVDANPGNDAARVRIATTVYQRGTEAEAKGAREQALGLYEQALSLRGRNVAEWSNRAQAVRKGLSDEYYQKGMQAYRTDTATAIRLWEQSLRYDAKNTKTQAKLQEAKMAQEKLKQIK